MKYFKILLTLLSLFTVISCEGNAAVNYTLTYIAGTHGSITGNSPQTVAAGSDGTPVTAKADDGFHFTSWTDDSVQNPRTDKNIQTNLNVTANFEKDITSYTLTYTAGAHGSITGNSPQTIAAGSDGTPVTAKADDGFHFTSWSDNSTQNPRTDTNVQADLNVTANFEKDKANYILTYTAGAHGSITGNSPQTVAAGSDGTPVTAKADDGFHFTSWTDDSVQNPRTDKNIQASLNVTAKFEKDKANYTLTYTAGAHGSINGSSPQTVAAGSDGTPVTAKANNGFHFTSWSDESVQNPRTDSNVQSDLNVTANFAENVSISTLKNQYNANELVSVSVNGQLSGDKDWVGVYLASANNDWANVIAWNWVSNGTTELTKDPKPMPAGDYEVRLFFHNSFNEEATDSFTVSSDYGSDGGHPVDYHDEVATAMTRVYFPTDIPDGEKVPVVFFASGYGSTDATDYESLLKFIASHGYYVIYAKQDVHAWNSVFANMDKMLDNANGILPKLDTTRIGVIGHSLGGGYAFNILKHFSDMGYGENGRFIMVLEGYFAYNLTKEEMQNLPANTNIIMQQYGPGGNNAVNDTDPRITLTEYYLLDSIAKNKKDWQIIENADHNYPKGNKAYTQMQGILKPLDALMAYTFENKADAHDIALEQGSDDPYKHGNGIQIVNPTDSYHYKCDRDINVAIDYCDMAQWYSNKQLILHQKGHWLPSMAGNFASRAAYINSLPFSGFTMVGNSYTNRVMEPNTPLLSYSYIWNEVKDVKGLYPAKSNFLVVHMHFPGDFWDDSVWNNVIANFKTLAKVAKNLGFRGIIYDDEPYDLESHKMNNYKHGNEWFDDNAYKNPNYTFAEHSAKITARFKQIMEAMVSEYPAIDVLYYHSPVEGHIKANRGINGHPVVVNVGLERQHEWNGAMFLGFKKGLSHQATLHDMGEDYRLRSQTHFDDAYTWRKHTIASNAINNAVDATQHWIVPQEERATWADEVHVNFMVSNEPLASADYPEFDTTNSVGLNDMKTTLERSLDKSDKYVIFYSASSSDNKGGLIQLDWLNDPAIMADDGTPYGLNPAWKTMVEGVYDNKVLK